MWPAGDHSWGDEHREIACGEVMPQHARQHDDSDRRLRWAALLELGVGYLGNVTAVPVGVVEVVKVVWESPSPCTLWLI